MGQYSNIHIVETRTKPKEKKKKKHTNKCDKWSILLTFCSKSASTDENWM